MKTLLTWKKSLATLALLVFLLSILPAVAEAGTTCRLGGSPRCRLDVPEISTMWMELCEEGFMVLNHSGGTYPELKKAGFNYPGYENVCCVAEYFKLNSDNNPLYTRGEMPRIYTAEQVSERQIMVDYAMTKYGENGHLIVNFTAVKNGILIQYDAYNAGTAPWSVGWKYGYNLMLSTGTYSGGNAKPCVKVEGRDGDAGTKDGVYCDRGQDFGDSRDIRYVKQWNTRTGPDAPGTVKSWFWWDPDWGATPADHLQYTSYSSAWSKEASWEYTSDENLQGDSFLNWYYGKPKLYNLKPGEHKEVLMWLATDDVDPLIAYDIKGRFKNRERHETSAVVYTTPGETVEFPITIESQSGVNGQVLPIDQNVVLKATQIGSSSGDWSATIVDPETGALVTSLNLKAGTSKDLRLRVKSDKDAFGLDSAQVNFVAKLEKPPAGTLYNKKKSVFEVSLFTTTIITPIYGISLEGPQKTETVMPGESLEYTVKVRNSGNLRNPIPIEMDIASGAGGWGVDFTPGNFPLKRNEEKEVVLKLDVPGDAYGGEQVVVVRATVESLNQFNTTSFKVRVLGEDNIDVILPEELLEDGLMIPPGGTRRVDVEVVNKGAKAIMADIHGVPDATLNVGDSATKPSEWLVEVTKDALATELVPGQSVKVPIDITAPVKALAGEQQNVLVFSTEKGQSAKLDSELLRVVVDRVTQLPIDPVVTALSADPGQLFEFEFLVRNVGNSVENITVELSKLPADWVWNISPERFTLEPQAQGSADSMRLVRATLSSPPKERAGLYELGVLLRNGDLVRSNELALKARINPIFAGKVTTETPTLRMLPEDTANIIFEVTNNGNTPDRFSLSGFNPTWTIRTDPEITKELQPGEKTLVKMSGTINGQLGTFQMPIHATSLGFQGVPTKSEPAQLTLVVSRPNLHIKAVKIESAAQFDGDIETIVAEIENLGGIEAKNVRVTLLADNLPTGTVVDFERLAPERTLIASLPWTKLGDKQPTYRVVVDPLNTVDEGEAEGDNEQVISAGNTGTAKEVPLLGASGRLAQNVPMPSIELLFLAALVGLVLMSSLRSRKALKAGRESEEQVGSDG